MAPSIVELDPRARNQILDRRGDEHLSGRGHAGDSRPDVHADTPYLLPGQLDFPCVQTRPDLEAQVASSISDRLGTANRSSGAVECRQEPVACGIDLATSEAPQLSSDQFVVFRDADTERIGVLYKRKDGNFGLSEP